jgi:hypothetical protein
MISQKAKFKFNDIDLLEKTVDKFNELYSNTSRNVDLVNLESNSFEIIVTDDGNLLPYGIFNIGTSIGSQMFYKNYRIKLTGKWNRLNKTIYQSSKHPKDEFESIMFDKTEVLVDIKKSTGVSAAIGIIKPFLSNDDFNQVVTNCKFQKIGNPLSNIYTTENGLRINYTIQDNYLIIFGAKLEYGKSNFRVDLDSIYEIELPDYEI